MREKIYWALTPEILKRRKRAIDVLSKSYDIHLQMLMGPEPPVPAFLAEQNCAQSIYIFELSTDFSFEHCQTINQTLESEAKVARSSLLLGSLDEKDQSKRHAIENWLPTLDGILCQSQKVADEMTLKHCHPTKFIPFPAANGKHEQDYFLAEFSSFLTTLRLVKSAINTVEKVSTELKYLGVSADSFLIDTVAETLAQFWD